MPRRRSEIWDYDVQELQKVTEESTSISKILRHYNLNDTGGNHRTLRAKLEYENISYAHIQLGRKSNAGRKFPDARMPPTPKQVENTVLAKDGLKRCSDCSEIKLLADFGLRYKNTEQRHYNCRACQTIKNKEHYQANKQYYYDKNRRWGQQNFDAIFAYKEERGCVDCGMKDGRVLDFDHLGDKEFGIATKARSMAFVSILPEIEKCEIVCSNCHRIRTWERKHISVGE